MTNPEQRKRRIRRLGDDLANLAPDGLHRRLVRAAANRLRVTWKQNPWMPGLTLDLGAQEAAFRDALAAADGFVTALPYAVTDWARWKWRRAFLDGRQVPAIWRDALAALPGRIAKAGPPPAGWAWAEPAAPGGMAYEVPVRLPPGSKRRLPDPVRALVVRAAAPIEGDDEARAIVALREHAETLAPVLALAATEDARLRLALAFARLSAGEIDHREWLDALAAATGR